MKLNKAKVAKELIKIAKDIQSDWLEDKEIFSKYEELGNKYGDKIVDKIVSNTRKEAEKIMDKDGVEDKAYALGAFMLGVRNRIGEGILKEK